MLFLNGYLYTGLDLVRLPLAYSVMLRHHLRVMSVCRTSIRDLRLTCLDTPVSKVMTKEVSSIHQRQIFTVIEAVKGMSTLRGACRAPALLPGLPASRFTISPVNGCVIPLGNIVRPPLQPRPTRDRSLQNFKAPL